VDLELGLGWFRFIENSLPHPCYVGIASYYGNHDGEIGANTIGAISGVPTYSTMNVGIGGVGMKSVLMHDNTLAGADGSTSVGLVLRDFPTGQPPIDSAANLIWGNHVTAFAGGVTSFKGILGTDCYYTQPAVVSASGAPCQPILPFMMSPTPGSTLTSTSPTFTWSSAPGAQAYELWLGTALGKDDLFEKSTLALSLNPTNLPNNGSTIFVRLYFKINGVWHYVPYVYTAP
jgi:hypothetical protein